MSEIMDDYDAGLKKGQYDMNRIVALKEDLAYDKGYKAGQNDISFHKIEFQIRDALDKYQLSNFANAESRRCITQVILDRLKGLV